MQLKSIPGNAISVVITTQAPGSLSDTEKKTKIVWTQITGQGTSTPQTKVSGSATLAASPSSNRPLHSNNTFLATSQTS